MQERCIGTDTLCDFLEGRADPGARHRVVEHTARCAPCRALLSSLARSGTPPPVPGPATADLAASLAPGAAVGRYVIESEIGAGGMGVVYAARDPALGRLVAVKVLRSGDHPSTDERIRREARAMARLAHPHVVAVYDVGRFEDRIFVAMEYVAGATLARWSATPRSPREILDAYCAAGRGLAAAHAAGIVHRDFKPENVFVGHDGRVRVGDFGVARTIGARFVSAPSSGAAALPVGTDPSTKPARLTAPGTLLGTPYYIAPELYDGADADARSDQFSFCVALFTTLYGERPFDGDTFTMLAANVRAGRIRRPRATQVPRRIHAAIRRGLSADPAARFRSLRHLLAELQPAPQRRFARAPVLAAGVALVLGAGVVWWGGHLAASATDERCAGGSPPIAAVWNASRRAAVEAAFTASRLPYAAAALRRVTDALDRFAGRWEQADGAACRTTEGDPGHDAERALRTWCLASRWQDAAALIDTLAAADRSAIEHAVAAAAGLSDPARCADPTAIRQIGVAPPDAAIPGLFELTQRLGQARAALATGAHARARQLVLPIVAAAHALGYRPLEAEAELLSGAIARALGDGGAEPALMNAIWSAEAGRDDAVAARARVSLVAVVGIDRAEPARALTLVPLATASIARLGGDLEIEASLETTLGRIAFAQRDLGAAVDHLENAIVAYRRASGDDGLALAGALDQLAIATLAQGHADRAAELAQRSLAISERWLGAEHPEVAAALHDLGTAHAALGELAAAESELQRASAIRERALGPDAPSRAQDLSDLARVVRHRGRGEEALLLARRAVAIGEHAPGVSRAALADLRVELGLALAGVERYAEADAELTRAEASLVAKPGADPVRAMLAAVARGDVLLQQARWRDAAALYTRAVPVLEAAQGTGDAAARALAGLCRTRVELQQPARAVPALERLAGQRDELPREVRVAAEFTLARALWDTGGDRPRARALATRALADIRGLADARPTDVAQIERWLASHRA